MLIRTSPTDLAETTDPELLLASRTTVHRFAVKSFLRNRHSHYYYGVKKETHRQRYIVY